MGLSIHSLGWGGAQAEAAEEWRRRLPKNLSFLSLAATRAVSVVTSPLVGGVHG